MKKRKKDQLSADNFNKYFCSVADELISTMNTIPQADLTSSDVLITGHFDFHEITFNELREVFSVIKSTSSNDAYGLNYKLLKCVKNLILMPLTKLINFCIRNHVFPVCLSISRVIPIYKKGNINEASNYRPISLTPVIGKIFETVLSNQLRGHLENGNFLNLAQFGFRQGKSTTQAVSALVNKVQFCFENKLYAQASFYDLTKAFDCVSHDLLLGKLIRFGIGGGSVNLIRSYLENRSQYVEYRNNCSQRLLVGNGVPQGSVLGPLLFLLFINDITDSIDNVILFADDTTTVDVSETYEELQQMVADSRRSIVGWFGANLLSVNAAKTQSLCLSLRKISCSVEAVKYLGVYIDSGLTWETHTVNLAKKLNKIIFTVRFLRDHVCHTTLLKVYYGYFYPHLAYAILCWGHSTHTSLVFGAQRRCVRVMGRLGYRDCCRSLFRNCKIMTVPCIYIFHCLIHVKTNLTAYKQHNEDHHYGTRRNQQLVPSYNRTERARDGINYFGIKFYNALPTHVKSLSLTIFKTRVKAYLLERCFYSCQEYLEHNFNDLV